MFDELPRDKMSDIDMMFTPDERKHAINVKNGVVAMLRRFVLLILFISIYELSAYANTLLPPPWAQHNIEEYEAGIITSDTYQGQRSAFLKSRASGKATYGKLWQSITPPHNWLGKRIQLTAFIQTKGVKSAAGMYMKIYAESGMVADFMKQRPIKGEINWSPYSIVLDIPYDATVIGFGVWLNDEGEIRVDNFNFKIVDSNIETTGYIKQLKHGQPENLDFETVSEN